MILPTFLWPWVSLKKYIIFLGQKKFLYLFIPGRSRKVSLMETFTKSFWKHFESLLLRFNVFYPFCKIFMEYEVAVLHYLLDMPHFTSLQIFLLFKRLLLECLI